MALGLIVAFAGWAACDGSARAVQQEAAPDRSERPKQSDGTETPPSPFDSERAWSDLETIVGFGERTAGSSRLERLREFLIGEFEEMGLDPVREAFRDETPVGVVNFANVYADIPGETADGTPPPYVVLLSHIDTKKLPFEFVGANDGGSSTAVLLELARVLVREEKPRPVTYRILFVDGEEAFRRDWSDEDSCYGSRHHVAELIRTDTIGRFGACVVLDLVGDKDLQLTYDTSSDPRLLAIFFLAAQRVGLGQHVGAPAREMRDDHLSFLNAGIPAVDLIDFEYEHWHKAGDTLDKCSRESLDAIGRIVLAGLPDLEKLVLENR